MFCFFLHTVKITSHVYILYYKDTYGTLSWSPEIRKANQLDQWEEEHHQDHLAGEFRSIPKSTMVTNTWDYDLNEASTDHISLSLTPTILQENNNIDTDTTC